MSSVSCHRPAGSIQDEIQQTKSARTRLQASIQNVRSSIAFYEQATFNINLQNEQLEREIQQLKDLIKSKRNSLRQYSKAFSSSHRSLRG